MGQNPSWDVDNHPVRQGTSRLLRNPKSITCSRQFVIGQYLYPLIYHFMAHLLELECFSISH